MTTPIYPKDIDVNNFKYSEVKSLSSGAKSVYINYGSGKLRIQTPVMYLPYGVNEGGYEDKNAKGDKKVEKVEKKFELTLSFKGHEDNQKIESFLTKMKEIEQKIIDDAFANREPWFKDEDMERKFVEKIFSPIIKVDKDKNTGKVIGKYPPTIRFKLPFDNDNNVFKFSSYNMNRESIDLLDIVSKLKGGKAQLIVELNSIWFAGGRFGCTWKLVTGKFQRSVNNDISFLDDSDTEKIKDDVEEEEEETEVENITTVVDTTRVENSDEEYVEEGVEDKPQVLTQVVDKKKGRGAKK
jgi:Family of unknown function (DUF5871)